MLRPIDEYFEQHEPATRTVLQFLRRHILQQDPRLTEAWKYRMPFFCYERKMCCYLWTHKRFLQPYLGIVEGSCVHHVDLLQENRARMKILLLDPLKDLPMEKIDAVLQQMLAIYKT